jgi:hypothetical protein
MTWGDIASIRTATIHISLMAVHPGHLKMAGDQISWHYQNSLSDFTNILLVLNGLSDTSL